MEKDISLPQMSPAQREAENEANHLIEYIENALAVVATGSSDEVDSIEAAADRIERVSRDLVFALRELARGRAASGES
jgi:hypothetical protein